MPSLSFDCDQPIEKLLQTASVLGREFHLALLMAIWERDVNPGPVLADLKRWEFLRELSTLTDDDARVSLKEFLTVAPTQQAEFEKMDTNHDGYLSEAEAAYQSGEISDYFLFPTGKLQRGAYVPLCRATDKPLSDHTLREKFGELEAIAGVEHRRGRAFYGLRRQATDLAPEFAQDAQVLNRISGHSDSATRERIYQDPQNERVRARAAEARRNMRAFLSEADQKKAA